VRKKFRQLFESKYTGTISSRSLIFDSRKAALKKYDELGSFKARQLPAHVFLASFGIPYNFAAPPFAENLFTPRC